MELSKETVEYVAHLARINLNQIEIEQLSRQLKDILDFIDTLKTVDVSEIAPTSHILPLKNVVRADSVEPSLDRKDVLACAPEQDGSFFIVPQVIE